MPELAPGKPCPICGKPADDKLRPFCSRRCADVDLHRWFSGVYSVPVVEDEDEDGEKPEKQTKDQTK
ncbi:MAG: DNA gyrase inhibitor YacG [Pseudolabrys sp.]